MKAENRHYERVHKKKAHPAAKCGNTKCLICHAGKVLKKPTKKILQENARLKMKKKILNSESIPEFNESINSLSKERKDYIDKQFEMIAEEKKIIKQTIECPECGCVQDAEVKLAIPFDIYIHDCEKCGYTIMESEWEIISRPESHSDQMVDIMNLDKSNENNKT